MEFFSINHPSYVILVALIHRAKSEGQTDFTNRPSGLYRVEATSREMAVLQHGDQCYLDGAIWRITAHNTETNVIIIKEEDVFGNFILKAFDGNESNLQREISMWVDELKTPADDFVKILEFLRLRFCLKKFASISEDEKSRFRHLLIDVAKRGNLESDGDEIVHNIFAVNER